MNVLNPCQNQKGFTMVELVIVIVLIGIIGMMASLLIGQASQTYQKEDNYSAIISQGRLAIEEMSREIRMIRSASDISTCAGSSFIFNDMNGVSVNYSYSGSTLLAGANVLADNLSSLSFSYFDNTGAATATCASVWTVTINLTAGQGGDTLPIRITLHPRSF